MYISSKLFDPLYFAGSVSIASFAAFLSGSLNEYFLVVVAQLYVGSSELIPCSSAPTAIATQGTATAKSIITESVTDKALINIFAALRSIDLKLSF